jgi:hypothetical protein
MSFVVLGEELVQHELHRHLSDNIVPQQVEEKRVQVNWVAISILGARNTDSTLRIRVDVERCTHIHLIQNNGILDVYAHHRVTHKVPE